MAPDHPVIDKTVKPSHAHRAGYIKNDLIGRDLRPFCEDGNQKGVAEGGYNAWGNPIHHANRHNKSITNGYGCLFRIDGYFK
jgi:hypothetical protein